MSALRASNDAVRDLWQQLQAAAGEIEQIGASIEEVSRAATEASAVAVAGSRDAESIQDAVRALGASGEEIGQVVKLITAIAQQTSLLALNATIEAARAGESGKGFAVVANEVKQLARSSAAATEEVADKIAAMQTRIEEVVGGIGGLADVIGRFSDYHGTVAAAVEQQNVSTNQLAQTVGEAAQGSASLVERLGS